MGDDMLGHGQYLDKNGMFRPIEEQTSIRLDNLEKESRQLAEESRRVTENLATLNDILLTEGKILDILVNTLADLEKKGEKK